MIDTILNDLYDEFAAHSFEGEDRMLHFTPPSVNKGNATYWREINEARDRADSLAWDGLLSEAYFVALSEDDPNLKADALLRLAATAFAFAGATQRQTDDFNEEPEVKRRKKTEGDGE